MAKWQAKKEDFGEGWIVETLASSHPHSLKIRTNIFTKKVEFFYPGKNMEILFDDFDSALEYFNKLV